MVGAASDAIDGFNWGKLFRFLYLQTDTIKTHRWGLNVVFIDVIHRVCAIVCRNGMQNATRNKKRANLTEDCDKEKRRKLKAFVISTYRSIESKMRRRRWNWTTSFHIIKRRRAFGVCLRGDFIFSIYDSLALIAFVLIGWRALVPAHTHTTSNEHENRIKSIPINIILIYFHRLAA